MHVTSVQPWIRVTGLACFTAVVLNACGGGGSGGSAPVAPRVIATIAVSPSGLTLNALGATAQLEATARDQHGDTIAAQVTWGSSDTAIATVDADGLVTAVNNGTATVTVRSGAVSNSVNVSVEQQAESVTLSRDEAVLTAVGDTLQLEAVVSDANDNSMSSDISWESSDPSVVLVDEDGLVTAVNNGTATVTVRSGAVSNSVNVSVEQQAASVALSRDEAVLTAVGDTCSWRRLSPMPTTIPCHRTYPGSHRTPVLSWSEGLPQGPTVRRRSPRQFSTRAAVCRIRLKSSFGGR